MHKVTIKDVAKKAGVAFQTASKILNNTHPSVSDATRQRVKDAARELNYRPNQFARAMKKGKTGIIGVTFPGVNQFRQFIDPYLSQLYAGIGSVLSDNGYKMIFHSIKADDGGDDQSLDLAESGVIDGLIYILFSAEIDAYEERVKQHLQKLRVPVALIHSSGRKLGFPAVGQYVAGDARDGVQHLFGHGYGTVGLVVSDADICLVHDVRRGYGLAHDEAGRKVDDAHIHTYTGWSASSGQDLARTLLERNTPLPRALFVERTAVAYGMLEVFRERGIRVPEDVAVLAFGEHHHIKFRPTELSVLEPPVLEKGIRAAELLLHSLREQNGGAPQEMLHAVPRYRRSCGCMQPAQEKEEKIHKFIID